MRYLDLFAGAGGLSEGFIRAGFEPVAHVEISKAACFTLKTRTAFHYLKDMGNLKPYIDYTSGLISREKLYSFIPDDKLSSVICEEIKQSTLKQLFQKIDSLKGSDNIDLIVGGPPCQAYSLVGRARDPNNMLNDKRNYLFSFYVKFLKKYKPKFFVFENVLGLLSAKDKINYRYFDMMLQAFNQCGYNTDYAIINSKHFGILQNRKRVIIVGKKDCQPNFKFSWPMPVHTQSKVEAVFSDLPPIKAGSGDVYKCTLSDKCDQWLIDNEIRSSIPQMPVTFHCSRTHKRNDLEIYKIAVEMWNTKRRRLRYTDLPEYLKTHNNNITFLDRFKVVAGNEPTSQTIVAHIAKDGHYYIHPDIIQNRSLTPREAARLQTFPDDYYFESISGKPSRTDAYRQIGNAVPVRLAYLIAEKLKEVWDND